MDGKGFWIILAVIIVGFFGFVMFSKDDKAANSSSASSQGSQNFYGKEDSPVTVTEFVDFQCEACYAYYPYVKEVKEKYKDKVRFQVRNFPITSGHQFAFQAARAAEAAARQGKFWEMHDKIFEGQKVWERTQNPQSYFDQYAKEIGLDMNKYKADRDSSDVAAVINKDLADVKELGGTGTPTFAINGKKVDKTAPSVEALSQMIDDALGDAQSN
jgi:protein-disulfide isomerase